MPVAFDAATEGSRTTQNPFTSTHTPVGVPKAVVVIVIQNSFTSDDVTAITYGGVALNQDVALVSEVTTEPGTVRIAFLGKGIPRGAQTVSVAFGSGTTPHWIVALTFTAAGDTEIVHSTGFAVVQENRANPQEVVLTGRRACLAVGGLFSGTASVPVGTLLSGMSRVHDHDWGNQVSTVDRQTTAASADFTFGYTLASDDAALAVISIAEILSPPTIVTFAALERAGSW